MEQRHYITFPAWCWDNEWAFRVCVWIGERLNQGCYCFKVKERTNA